MTSKGLFESLLIELAKQGSPSMLLQDFNYYANKAVNQYINKRYNIYDVNQQTTDDLRVLKASAILTPTQEDIDPNKYSTGAAKLFGGTYSVNLPDDYLHMLNCDCIYHLNKRYKCYNKGDYVQFSATRLTSDSWSTISNDLWNRPLPWRPYYYINNVNMNSEEYPYNPVKTDDDGYILSGTDANYTNGEYDYTLASVATDKTDSTVKGNSNFPRKIKIPNNTNRDNFVEREAGYRYGNVSKVRCELRTGRDSSVFKLEEVRIDYIKAPQTIRLTQEQIDLIEDTSQILEFPDYVCQEIINELVHLVQEAVADPRLQTNMAVTQSIANPVQQQNPQPQQQYRG